MDRAGEAAYERLLAAVRHASSQRELSSQGVEAAFRLEDTVRARVTVSAEERGAVDRWLRRRLAAHAAIGVRVADPPDGCRLEATLARRGTLSTSQRRRYERVDGRIRVEAFELHVVEHCNLRCAHCCNMSPYVDEATLSVDAIERMCRSMAEHLEVDVFKIMGGEPLLHPDIAGALRAVRRSGISGTVRLFTNGLLLHRMDEAFWDASMS